MVGDDKTPAAWVRERGTWIAQTITVTFDRLAVGLVVLSFASLLTAHVVLTMGLARRSPRWRAVVAFFALPLAPWWGWREKMRAPTIVWIVAASCYALSLVVACTG